MTPSQGRRKLFSIGAAGYGGGSRNLRAGVGTAPAQLGSMGERRKLLHQGLGGPPEANAFCVEKNSENYAKKRRPGDLLNSIYIVYMAKQSYNRQ